MEAPTQYRTEDLLENLPQAIGKIIAQDVVGTGDYSLAGQAKVIQLFPGQRLRDPLHLTTRDVLEFADSLKVQWDKSVLVNGDISLDKITPPFIICHDECKSSCLSRLPSPIYRHPHVKCHKNKQGITYMALFHPEADGAVRTVLGCLRCLLYGELDTCSLITKHRTVVVDTGKGFIIRERAGYYADKKMPEPEFPRSWKVPQAAPPSNSSTMPSATATTSKPSPPAPADSSQPAPKQTNKDVTMDKPAPPQPTPKTTPTSTPSQNAPEPKLANAPANTPAPPPQSKRSTPKWQTAPVAKAGPSANPAAGSLLAPSTAGSSKTAASAQPPSKLTPHSLIELAKAGPPKGTKGARATPAESSGSPAKPTRSPAPSSCQLVPPTSDATSPTPPDPRAGEDDLEPLCFDSDDPDRQIDDPWSLTCYRQTRLPPRREYGPGTDPILAFTYQLDRNMVHFRNVFEQFVGLTQNNVNRLKRESDAELAQCAEKTEQKLKAAHKVEINKLIAESVRIKAERNNIVAEGNMAMDEAFDLRRDVDSAKRALENKATEAEALHAELDQAIATAANQSRMVDAKDAELKQISEAYKLLEAKLKTAETDVATQSRMVDAKDAELTTTQGSLALRDGRILDLEEEIQALGKQVAKMREKRKQLEWINRISLATLNEGCVCDQAERAQRAQAALDRIWDRASAAGWLDNAGEWIDDDIDAEWDLLTRVPDEHSARQSQTEGQGSPVEAQQSVPQSSPPAPQQVEHAQPPQVEHAPPPQVEHAQPPPPVVQPPPPAPSKSRRRKKPVSPITGLTASQESVEAAKMGQYMNYPEDGEDQAGNTSRQGLAQAETAVPSRERSEVGRDDAAEHQSQPCQAGPQQTSTPTPSGPTLPLASSAAAPAGSKPTSSRTTKGKGKVTHKSTKGLGVSGPSRGTKRKAERSEDDEAEEWNARRRCGFFG